MIDFQILKYFMSNRNAYFKYREYLTFEDQGLLTVAALIGTYFSHNDASAVTGEELVALAVHVYPPQQVETLKNLIEQINLINLNNIKDLILIIYNKHKLLSVNKLINNKLLDEEFNSIDDVVDELSTVDLDDTFEFSELDLKSTVSDFVGYTWQTEELNERLGTLPPATFGLIAAMVEVGKTAFVIDSIINFLSQGAKILHLNNEDSISKLLERYYIRFFEKPKAEIFINLDEYSEAFKRSLGGRLLLLDSAELSLGELSGLVKYAKPDIMIIDQLDPLIENVEPAALEHLYKNIRRLAKDHKTRIVGVTQAADHEGPYLAMRDLHFSRVGKQAALDYFIGIGKADTQPALRFFSLPKNKLTGDHRNFKLRFRPDTMKFYSDSTLSV